MNNKTQISVSSVMSLLLYIFGLIVFALGLFMLGFAIFNFVQSLSDASGLSAIAGIVALIIGLGIALLGWKISRHYYRKYHQSEVTSPDKSTATPQDPSQPTGKSGIFFDS